jgi:NADH dehydrogenase FAD-containing subunit
MKRIVIIGGGFAGLAAAKALRHSNADILVIDLETGLWEV